VPPETRIGLLSNQVKKRELLHLPGENSEQLEKIDVTTPLPHETKPYWT
jgi:hypothetical protein